MIDKRNRQLLEYQNKFIFPKKSVLIIVNNLQIPSSCRQKISGQQSVRHLPQYSALHCSHRFFVIFEMRLQIPWALHDLTSSVSEIWAVMKSWNFCPSNARIRRSSPRMTRVMSFGVQSRYPGYRRSWKSSPRSRFGSSCCSRRVSAFRTMEVFRSTRNHCDGDRARQLELLSNDDR